MNEQTAHNSLQRFSDRVENYVKFRPAYPAELFQFLSEEGMLKPGLQIADVGSGTGISARPFVEAQCTVFGVEPNAGMRTAAEMLFAGQQNFVSVKGTAENSTLPDASVDMVVAGQAFHWFNRLACAAEFKRILKPGGKVLLMWNDRRTDTNDFLKVYEDFLMMFGTDYAKVNHKQVQDKNVFDDFFGESSYREKWFDNFQDVDFTGLKGRVLSASYMPDEQHTDYPHMMYCLKKIFMRYQVNGLVRLEYDTKIYYGTLKK